MRVTSVEIHTSNSSEVCVLSYRDPRRLQPYNVLSISGLDAEEIIPRFYGNPGNSATIFSDMVLEEREIIVFVQLNPRYSMNETPSSLRDALYRMIAASRTGLIQLRFKDGSDVVAAVSGFITKFEAPLFSEKSQIQITIKCDEPMLRALDPIDVDVSSLNPGDTTIEDELSNAPHGFKFEMAIDFAMDSFTIQDASDLSWSFVVTPVGGFLVDDVLFFSSETNNKYIYLVRDDETIYLADVIQQGSVWPIMFPGENTFVCADEIRLTWNAISYYPTYWGV